MREIQDAATAARRMQVLKALALQPKYCADPRNLRAELEITGYAMTLTKLAMECAFLAELGLVTSLDAGQLSLTDDGLSVVRGLVTLPGIGTPEPGEL